MVEEMIPPVTTTESGYLSEKGITTTIVVVFIISLSLSLEKKYA